VPLVTCPVNERVFESLALNAKVPMVVVLSD
jgi:hypothetical protein